MTADNDFISERLCYETNGHIVTRCRGLITRAFRSPQNLKIVPDGRKKILKINSVIDQDENRKSRTKILFFSLLTIRKLRDG